MPSSLRICFLTQKLPRTGAAADYGYVWPLCKNLAARGHDVTVISSETTQGPMAQNIENVQIHFVESPLASDYNPMLRESALDRLEQLHVEKPFDLVHSVDNTGIVAALNKKQLGIPLAADVKGIELDQIFGLLGLTEDTVSSYLKTSFVVGAKFLKSFFGVDRKLLKAADGVFVTSRQQMDILELYYFVPSRKIHIIPFGINAKDLNPQESENNPFEELGIGPSVKVILTIAPLLNVEETKNLLNAFERVVIKKPDTALVIIGDGPRRGELEEHMLNLALASKVHFTGSLPADKIDAYMKGSFLYVNLSSRSSGFEPTVLDAMACCKTVIASEVGTSSNVIVNSVDGFLLRPTEIKALSRLLLEAVSDQIDTGAIGQRAREKMLKMFDTTRMVDETVRAYHDILRSTGKYK